MIGEIERLLLNKLNNGERYFCSSELPKDESSLFELDSATRRELARLTSDGVIRKAETGAYEILLDGGAIDAGQMERFVGEVKAMKGVSDVVVPLGMVEQINSTISSVRLVLLVFGAVLLVISLILLNNTIRVSIFSKRYIINTMKLVGATKWFIMRPFLASSIAQGLWAGVAAAILFVTVVWRIDRSMPELNSLTQLSQTGVILAAMIAGGVVISLLFTTFAVNKFVNMKSNKIHLY